MRFYAFGLNHETASVQTREAFALDTQDLRDIYEAVQLAPASELIVLSTCNRTEAYLFGGQEDVKTVQSVLCTASGHPWPGDSFIAEDEDAIRHIMEVACGLRSLVLGENQILAQMKEAYQLASDAGIVATQLHRLMHTTFRATKQVSRETELSDGVASVSSAAVTTARRHFTDRAPGGLAGRRVLLIGAGRMGQLALDALQAEDLGMLAVTNRTVERAQSMSDAFGAETVAWGDRHVAAARSDLVIVATSADQPVITPEELPAPKVSETVFIDIAIPRNVAPGVDERPNAKVFDLDALNAQLVVTEERRKAAAPKARDVVDDVMSDFVTWFFHQQALQPAIEALRTTFDSIRRREIDRHAHRLADTDREEIDKLTRSILQKLLAIPIVRLKNTDPESIDFVRGIRLLNTLFSRPDCEEEGEQAPLTQPPSAKVDACPFPNHLSEQAQELREDIDLYQELRTPSNGTEE